MEIKYKDSNELNTESAKNMLQHLTAILKEFRKPREDLDPDSWTKVKGTFVSSTIFIIGAGLFCCVYLSSG